tara:strand:- start:833 stop:1261 length:429 start_codon:yes stop_codon:yes gene_type:complete
MAKDILYKPTYPYTGKQIIIDSDRVTLNSKEDMTFLIAKKAISISSGGTVNIDSTGMTIINSPKIKLGLNAKHPLVHGDVLLIILKNFFAMLQKEVAPQLMKAQIEGSPVLSTVIAGKQLNQAVKTANDLLVDLLSTTNFTQ